jgi:hypothetical protein
MFSIVLITFYCLTNLLLATNSDHAPPTNPIFYQMEWNIYTVDKSNPPPINTTIARLNGTGRTFYDWESRSMLEIYDNFCVPIFESPNKDFKFPCHFLNTGEVVYLKVFNNPNRPACCIFARDFHPPKPTFAIDTNLTYNATTFIDNNLVDFWTMNIPPPGPFYYGWYRNITINGYRQPAAFAFLTVEPEDFTQQNFYNFKLVRPDKSVFEVSNECLKSADCVVF